MAAAEETKISDPLGERVIELIRQQKAASDEYNALLNKKVRAGLRVGAHVVRVDSP